MSLDKLEKTLRLNENLLRTVGPKLHDKGAKIEYTIDAIKDEIERAKQQIDELSASLSGLDVGSRGTPDGRDEKAGAAVSSVSSSLTGRGDSVHMGRAMRDVDVNSRVQAEYQKQLAEYKRSLRRRRFLRPRPPMPRVSFEEGNRIAKREEESSARFEEENQMMDAKHPSPITPSTPPVI